MGISNIWHVAKAAVKQGAVLAWTYKRIKLNFPRIDFGDRALTRLQPQHQRDLTIVIARKLLAEKEARRIVLPASGSIEISAFKYKVSGGKYWETVECTASWADLITPAEIRIKRAAVTVTSFMFAGREIKLTPAFEMKIYFDAA